MDGENERMSSLWKESQKEKQKKGKNGMDAQDMPKTLTVSRCSMCNGRGEVLRGGHINGKYEMREVVCPQCLGEGIVKNDKA